MQFCTVVLGFMKMQNEEFSFIDMDGCVINHSHPFGGTAILWRNNLFKSVQSYKIDSFGR